MSFKISFICTVKVIILNTGYPHRAYNTLQTNHLTLNSEPM